MSSKESTIIDMVNYKLPPADTQKGKEKIELYWPEFDKNRNGYLSLA